MPRTKAKAKTTKRKTTTRKTTARKPAARKTATRKTTARKAATKRAAPKKRATAKKAAPKKIVIKKVAAIKTPTTAVKAVFNKSQVLTYISDHTEISKKEVLSVFETLGNIMHRHLKKGGPGEFTVPGLMKCTVKRKPATPARRGINPFTGEEMTFKAKPARNVVKVRPLKKLKEMVE